jgi:hypothetical protein
MFGIRGRKERISAPEHREDAAGGKQDIKSALKKAFRNTVCASAFTLSLLAPLGIHEMRNTEQAHKQTHTATMCRTARNIKREERKISEKGTHASSNIQDYRLHGHNGKYQHIAVFNEMVGASFVNGTKSIDYFVSAVPQKYAIGSAVAYLINGLTENGYWYQIGLTYDWASFLKGFHIKYEVWNPQGKELFDKNGLETGELDFKEPIRKGDRIELRLTVQNGNVALGAIDLNSNASNQMLIDGNGASTFVGMSSNVATPNGYFTGIMEENHNSRLSPDGNNAIAFVPASGNNAPLRLWFREFGAEYGNDGETPKTIHYYYPTPVGPSHADHIVLEYMNVKEEYNNGTIIIMNRNQK